MADSPVDSLAEKKHAPSDMRRRSAREAGRVARSHDLGAAVVLLVGVVVLERTAPSLFQSLAGGFHNQLQLDFQTLVSEASDPRGGIQRLVNGISMAAWSFLPLMASLVAASMVVQWAQVGAMWQPEKLLPDWNRISPIQGLRRMWSGDQGWRLGFAVVKLLILTLGLWLGMNARWEAMLGLSAAGLPAVGAAYWQICMELCRNAAAAMVVLALIDYGIQRWRFEQELRMSDDELREEQKQTQGDPNLRSQRRKAQKEMAKAPSQALSLDADVVITGLGSIAVALRYDPSTMDEPRITGLGSEREGQRLMAWARRSAIEVVTSESLAEALFRDSSVGQSIPPSRFRAVAELLRQLSVQTPGSKRLRAAG